MAPELMSEEKAANIKKTESSQRQKIHDGGSAPDVPGLTSLQQHIGNRAVQRVLAQRRGEGSFDLDEAAAGRIKALRGSGQPLDTHVEKSLSSAMGTDFGGVKVHTSPEADHLSRKLGARAFTTGQDVFFRDGVYNPHTLDGQKTIAHELSHVVQQGSGMGGGVGRMTVGAAHDPYEQEADSIASKVVGGGLQVQTQGPEEEEIQEQRVQRQEAEEEELQMQAEEEEEPIQAQAPEEEEETLQPQAEEEGEEVGPTPGDKFLSGGMGRGLATGEGQGPLGTPVGVKDEDLQMQRVYRQEPEEEEVQMQAAEEEEEEAVQAERSEEDQEVVG